MTMTMMAIQVEMICHLQQQGTMVATTATTKSIVLVTSTTSIAMIQVAQHHGQTVTMMTVTTMTMTTTTQHKSKECIEHSG